MTSANIGSSIVPHATNGVPITIATQTNVGVSSHLGAGVIVGAGLQLFLRGDERTFGGGYVFHRVPTGALRGYLLRSQRPARVSSARPSPHPPAPAPAP